MGTYNIDAEITVASDFKEDTERWKDDSKDDLEDIAVAFVSTSLQVSNGRAGLRVDGRPMKESSQD